MKKDDLESLRKGIAEVSAYVEGVREGYVVHQPAPYCAAPKAKPGSAGAKQRPRG